MSQVLDFSPFTPLCPYLNMTSTSSLSTEWVYDPTHSVCYQASTQMFAIPSRSGQWEYVPITDFRPGESSTSHLTHKDKEEGEVEDDVGWGGLMEPEELQRVTSKAKHPAYTDPDKYAYGSIEVIPPSETPKHILRLVVSASPVLPIGGMAMIDAREGGIHIGRDRQIGQARLRIKEMEVSKTHAVVYWGRGCERIEDAEAEAEDEGWWIVDLGTLYRCISSTEGLIIRLDPRDAGQRYSIIRTQAVFPSSSLNSPFNDRHRPDYSRSPCSPFVAV